jgi:hypothetical protein
MGRADRLRMPPAPLVASTLVVGVWSVLCAALVHHGCYDISAPIPQPFPSTPRADYCDSVGSATPWITLTFVPTVLMAATAWLNLGNPRRVTAIAFVLCLALIANAVVANSLTYSIELR